MVITDNIRIHGENKYRFYYQLFLVIHSMISLKLFVVSMTFGMKLYTKTNCDTLTGYHPYITNILKLSGVHNQNIRECVNP